MRGMQAKLRQPGLSSARFRSSCAAPKCLPQITTWDSLGASALALSSLVLESKNLLAITGAGVSTESGIPDYRSPGRPAYRPLQHGEFVKMESTRRRYWARSMIGFGQVGKALPNKAHRSLALLEQMGKMSHLITQNVDRLHQKAGQRNILELHGTIHEVECLDCKHQFDRAHMQALLLTLNEEWMKRVAELSEARPDGDVELPSDVYSSFTIPPCDRCGSQMLKPRVTFHGGQIPPPVTEASLQLAQNCDGLLVVGSTVSTFSAYRLVREAASRHARVGIINYGPTRADELAAFKIEGSVGWVLSSLLQRLDGHSTLA